MLTKKITRIRGITLIETLIFIVLLSMLVAHMISYLYSVHVQNSKLLDEVHDVGLDKKGFIATTAMMILATGALAFVLVTSSAVIGYMDSVERREYRMQKRFNENVCPEIGPMLVMKGYVLQREISLGDFGCVVEE